MAAAAALMTVMGVKTLMGTIDNPVGYIFDQGQKGIEERAAGQLAMYQFQQMREKARSESAAKQGLASYYGADTPLGKIAAQDPAMAKLGVETQGALAKFDQDKQRYETEKKIQSVDQLAGMANAFANNPTPELHQQFSQLALTLNPGAKIPTFEVAASNPDKVVAEAQALMSVSQQMKLELDAKKVRGDDKLLSPQAEAQQTRMDTSKAAAGRAPSEGGLFGTKAQSTVGKAISDRMRLPPGSEEYKALTAVIDKEKIERDEKSNARKADVESARTSMDNMLSTADRLLSTKPSVIESATGPVSSRLPTFYDDVADFEETLSTFGSQAFLSMVPTMKGMGALSNTEGDKLQKALQSLSLRQSKEQLVWNLREAKRLIEKGRDNLATRYNSPDTPTDQPNRNITVDF